MRDGKQDSFAHGVSGVLDRWAISLDERGEYRLASLLPARSEGDLRVAIGPVRGDSCRKDSVAGFLEGCIAVLLIAFESGTRGFEDDQILNTGFYFDRVPRGRDVCCALLFA